jgi:hypothetical protein
MNREFIIMDEAEISVEKIHELKKRVDDLRRYL